MEPKRIIKDDISLLNENVNKYLMSEVDRSLDEYKI